MVDRRSFFTGKSRIASFWHRLCSYLLPQSRLYGSSCKRSLRTSFIRAVHKKEITMKRFIALLALGMFMAGGIIGCEASAKVGDDDANGSYSKKTTVTHEPDGDRTVRTEIHD
jgi:hypothetical protein